MVRLSTRTRKQRVYHLLLLQMFLSIRFRFTIVKILVLPVYEVLSWDTVKCSSGSHWNIGLDLSKQTATRLHFATVLRNSEEEKRKREIYLVSSGATLLSYFIHSFFTSSSVIYRCSVSISIFASGDPWPSAVWESPYRVKYSHNRDSRT